jgi:hypothetical protein
LRTQQITQRQGKDRASDFVHLLCKLYLFNICTLCRNGVVGPIKEWGIQDCINVHKLLDTILAEHDVANSKFQYGIPNLFIVLHPIHIN